MIEMFKIQQMSPIWPRCKMQKLNLKLTKWMHLLSYFESCPVHCPISIWILWMNTMPPRWDWSSGGFLDWRRIRQEWRCSLISLIPIFTSPEWIQLQYVSYLKVSINFGLGDSHKPKPSCFYGDVKFFGGVGI